MAILLFLMFAFQGITPPEWSWSAHPEAGFKILTPYILEDKIVKVPTAVDIVEYHQYSGGSLQDSVLAMAFVVDYYKMPGMTEAKDEAYLKDFFENTIDPLLEAIGGSLVYMDINRQATEDICVWKATYGDGLVRGNSILTSNRYYGLQVFGRVKDNPDDLMNKFLTSFKLME